MSITPLTTEPAAITAGDTISWKIALPDYPATGGWTLKYNLVNASARYAVASTADGADHAVAVAKATTAAWTPGTYTLAKYVEHTDGTRVTLAALTIQVLADIAGKTAGYDNRTHVKKVLDAIEAVLEGRAARSDAEYEIDTGNGRRRLKSLTPAELLKFRATYLQYYQQEQAAAKVATGAGTGVGKIRVRL